MRPLSYPAMAREGVRTMPVDRHPSGRPSPRSRNGRGGFTLIEMLIAVTIFGVIVAGALSFMTAQNRAFDVGSKRMTSLTNLQFAMQMLDTDIPTLGSGLVPSQPGVVYAADSTLAFNADLVTNASNDPFAVYFDPDAPTGQVTSPSAAVTVPLTSFSWPGTPFTNGVGSPAPAEMIQYGFYQDTSTPRTDDYVLGRSVNGSNFDVVARNLLKPSNGDPFMRFFIYRAFPSAPTQLDSIASGTLPLNANDFLADSIRAVRVSIRSTNGLTGADERITEMSRLITMKNAGMRTLNTCGDGPILTASLTATPGVDVSGDPIVTLLWGASVDDGSGENDVQRYVLWRRNVSLGSAFGDPLVSVPAGTGNTYVDSEVDAGTVYQYQVAAQDCTPALSGGIISLNAVVP